MFDFVHEKKRLVQFVLVLIILPFAFWGVDSYQKSGGGESLASVNGEKISAQEFDNAMRQQQQRMRELAGPAFDQSIFEKAEVKHSILEGLVAQHLLASEATKYGLMVTSKQLNDVVSGIDAFQKNGQVDEEQAETVLKAQGMTPQMFRSKLSQELISRQLTDTYIQNGYASNAVVDNLIRLNEQQRVVALLKFDTDALLKQIKVTDAMVDEYYKKNQSEFQMPERARVEYVVFSTESLQSQVTVDETEVKKYFDEHQSEFGTQEQRQAAHILISVAAQASDAVKQAAKTKAEQVLQQVKQSPDKFAVLAKEYSQDTGSAADGGNLGMMGRDAMVASYKSFGDELFKLKLGEVGGLVQTADGYHIIKLQAVKPSKTPALSEVKTLIMQRLKAQKAGDKFAELAEKFSNTVYEQSDSLKPAGELVKAPVQQGGWLNKGQSAGGIWTDKALHAVFSDEAVKNKRNTAAVEVAPNTLLAARVVEYQAASVRPLVEVSNTIQKKLQRQQALELMAKQGGELLSRLQQGEKVNVVWQPVQTITRSQHAGVDVELAKLIFKASAAKLPTYVGVQTAQNGFALARIDAVKDVATIDEGKRNRYLQQIRQVTGEELLLAYLADAKKHADISMKSFAADEKK